MGALTALLLLLNSLLIVSTTNYTPLLSIPQGKLFGLESKNGTVKKYFGIPYGTVPERYQAPGSPPIWKGILNATSSSVICPQYHKRLRSPTGDESCLKLNIFTPGLINYKRPYPVMVFIQGSEYGFNDGHFIYNPEPMVNKGVIVVTFNYRLGAFGFLCLKISGAPGNAGLKDQVAALKWIKMYINHFGGNPELITIFGQSDGASFVGHLILSSNTKGLFHRAIMQSGSPLSPFAFSNDPIKAASFVASKMGYNTKNPFELLDIFKNSTKNEIILATIDNNSLNLLSNYNFKPCLEKVGDSKPFMVSSPNQALKAGKLNKLPLIIGYNNKDGLIYGEKFNSTALDELNDKFEWILPDNLLFSNLEDRETIINEVKSIYFGDKAINDDMKDNLTDYFSDIFFHYPAVAFGDYFINSSYPVYQYYFKYDSPRNLVKLLSGVRDHKGVALGNEIFYLFQPTVLLPVDLRGQDKNVMQMMTYMWTNFAKYGDPTAVKSSFVTTKWRASESAGNYRYQIIDRTMHTVDKLPNSGRMEFWRYVYDKYGI